MAGGNEEHDETMEVQDDNDDVPQSSEQSECDDDDLDLGDMEYYDDANEYCSVHQNLKDDIRKALAAYPEAEEELGIPSIQIDETRTNLKYISAVVLTFTLKDISDHLLELWDLVDTPAIIMEMDNIHRGEFRNYGHLPTITVTKHSSEGHFIVGEQLKNFAIRLCRESFSLRTNESPETAGSFFADVYGKVKERLVRLSEYCVTCGEVLTSGGVLPSICERDLCMYQYTELHLFDGLSVPRVSPEVLSLLLFAFANANLSVRRKDILTPAPPIKSMADLLQEAKEKRLEKLPRGDSGEFPPSAFSDQDKKGSAYWNFTVSNAVSQYSSGTPNTLESATFSVLLENLPCPRDFLASVSAYHAFRKSWPEMSNIVDWLVISNRSYLEMVPKPMKVDFLHTSAQYCFVSDTPAKQAEFDALVAANGGKTRFFFHGSPLENWHSIIRSGLKNMSGTKYQLVGAAYGKGIYLTPFLDFALGYASRVGHSMSRRFSAMTGELINDRPIRSNCKLGECCETERKEDLSCVALVEVVDSPEAYAEKTDEIFVVEQDKWCSIRMLLLYRSSDISKLNEAVAKSWEKNGDYNLRHPPRGPRGTMSAYMSASAAAAAAAASANPSSGSAPSGQQPSVIMYPNQPGNVGFMSYMMSKFGSWSSASGLSSGPPAAPASSPATGSSSGTSSGSGSGADTSQAAPAPSSAPTGQSSNQQYAPNAPNIYSEHKAKMMKRYEEQKKEWAKRKMILGEKMAASAAKMAAASDASTSAPPALGPTLSSSSSDGLVDLTKDDDEDKPGTSSGLLKETEKERKARRRAAFDSLMAVPSSVDASTADPMSDDYDSGEWMMMSAKWRSKKERRIKKRKGDMDDDDKEKKDEDKKEKEKDHARRKRSNSDPTAEVPKKTASSPSTAKKEDEEHKLTEEDFKILEMFADSDLDEDEVQVTKMVPGKKKKSKQAEKKDKEKKEKKMDKGNEDETDDDIEILNWKDKLMKEQLILLDESNEKKVQLSDEKDKATGPTTRSKSASSLTTNTAPPPGPSSSTSTSSPFYTSYHTPTLNIPSPFSGPLVSGLHSMPPAWSITVPPPMPPPPVRQLLAGSASNVQIQHVPMAQPSPHLTQPPVQPPTVQQVLQGRPTSARRQQMAQRLQQLQSMALANPPPSGPTAGPPGSSVGSLSWLQSMGGMFSRRSRRRGMSADRQMPGDLTVITDEQREQIYRVVRMFRNSGFEERVNRHMNREGELADGGAGGDREEDADDEGEGSGDSMDVVM